MEESKTILLVEDETAVRTLLSQSLQRYGFALLEAASDLGATPFQVFRRVILPLSKPGIWSGCIMVFLLSCGAFVTTKFRKPNAIDSRKLAPLADR